MKITRTQSLSWGRKYFISKTNWKWHAATMTVLIPLTLFIQGGIIPVIFQSLRHMLHPNASHYSYPILSYFCVSSTWQSSKGLKYHLWSCCPTPPPPHQPCMLSSDTDSPSRCCETLWYRQTKPIFISLSLCHWLTYSCWSCSPCPYPLCPSKLYFYCESRRLRVSSCAFGNLFCSPCVYKGTVDQWWR